MKHSPSRTGTPGPSIRPPAGSRDPLNHPVPSDRRNQIDPTIQEETPIPAAYPAQVEMYPDVEAALAGLKAGEVDAVGLTSLSIRNLVDGEAGVEATAQFYPEVDGERVVGYGAFGFRQEDGALREAFNRELAGFIGSEAHLETVAPFGFTAEMVPERSVEELCGGE
jgi:hypothetical protein